MSRQLQFLSAVGLLVLLCSSIALASGGTDGVAKVEMDGNAPSWLDAAVEFVASPCDGGGQVCDDVMLYCRIQELPPMSMFIGARFYQKVDGVWVRRDDAGATNWVIPQLVTMDGIEYWAACCPWQSQDDKNQAYNWKVEYWVGEMTEPPMPPGADWFGEKQATWTPKNTIIKATGTGDASLFIKHHRGDTSHTINWNITHLQDQALGIDPKFHVAVQVYDANEPLGAPITKDNVAVGADSLTWQPPDPQVAGIFSYKITTQHDIGLGVGTCGDCDKVDAISNVSVTNFIWDNDDFPNVAYVILSYTCSEELSPCELQLFKPNLSQGTILLGTALDGGVGQHSVTVKFAVDKQELGTYRFIIKGVQADGSLNRDGTPKPTIPRGTVQSILAPATTCAGSDVLGNIYFFSAAQNTLHELGQFCDVPKYLTGSCYPAKPNVLEALRNSAIFAYYGHSESTVIDFRTSGNDGSLGTADLPADMSHVLLTLWMGCETSLYNNGSNFVSLSKKNGAACAIGWDGSVRDSCFPRFATYFWYDLSEAGMNADYACYDAVWSTWQFLGDYLTEGLFTYRVEGDVSIVPSRFGGN